MSVLSNISVSDLSMSLSLPLEIQCLDDSYSCVVSYSFTNRTTHLNITDLCRMCPGTSTFSKLFILYLNLHSHEMYTFKYFTNHSLFYLMHLIAISPIT